MPLTFAQAQFALGFVAQIAPERVEAFESRLKQWQKMGFPEGVNVGRGTKAAYGATQTFQLLFLLKLLQVGLTPDRAQRVVLAGWEAFKDAIVEATICLANGENHLHYCLIKLDALSDLRLPSADHMHVFVDTFRSDEIDEALIPAGEYENLIKHDEERSTPEARADHDYLSFITKNRLANCISIEVDSLLILLWIALQPMGLQPDVFASEIADWERERRARGRVEQETSTYYDDDARHGSIAQQASTFDAVQAAKRALSHLDKSSMVSPPDD